MNPDEVRRLARLGALELPDDRGAPLLSAEELARHARELTAILEHVRALSTLDLSGVPPTSHGLPLTAPLREDVPEAPLDRARALAGAARTVGDGFAVPKVIE